MTPDGQVLMGWVLGEYDITIYIDLEKEVGTYKAVHIETNEQIGETWYLFFLLSSIGGISMN